MIVDTIQNASRYFSIHPLFEKAFAYIREADLDNVEMGRYEIDGDNLKAIYSNKRGMSAAESVARFECHDKYIDIQLCIHGIEQIGWKPRAKCVQFKSEYNSEKDVRFFGDEPDMYFQLTHGQFAIFFPEDVHAPMIGTNEIKKLVIKVKI